MTYARGEGKIRQIWLNYLHIYIFFRTFARNFAHTRECAHEQNDVLAQKQNKILTTKTQQHYV